MFLLKALNKSDRLYHFTPNTLFTSRITVFEIIKQLEVLERNIHFNFSI
jgi:hypothetical protein